MKWSNKSRYGELREYEYSEELHQLKVVCHNILYCSYSNIVGSEQLRAVDPDGGPYLGVNIIIHNEDNRFLVREIVSAAHNHKSKKVTVILDVIHQV